MGSLVAAMASSHAFAVAPPEKWDELRERNRNVYAQRQNIDVPPPHPRMSEESSEDVQTRYARVHNGLLELKRIIEAVKTRCVDRYRRRSKRKLHFAECSPVRDLHRLGGGFFRPAFQRRTNLSMRR